MRSIRVYLLILVLGAMLPGALLTAILVWRAITTNRAYAAARLLESARIDALAVEREFMATTQALQVLSTSPDLAREDLSAFHDEARRLHSIQPGWYAVVLLARDGRQLINTRRSWGDPPQQAVEPDSLQRLFTTRQPVVGSIRPAASGGPEYLFAVRVPVLRDGELKYALSAIVNVDSLVRLVPARSTDSPEWTRSILDPEGTIAVRTRGAEKYVGSRATDAFLARLRRSPVSVTREVALEGQAVYTATGRTDQGWIAAVVVPTFVLDEPLLISIAGVLTGGFLLMLCGLATVLFVSRRLSSDIAAATAAAEAVAEGRPVPSKRRAHVAETQRLQQSLARAASLLENRAHERDAQIRRADELRIEAEEASQTKDQFLAVLGHELRNPLAPALTALELMKSRQPDVFVREREILQRQVSHMVRLVNDLLDVSRLARGKVQIERRRIELREVVDGALDMARPLIHQQGHTLKVFVPDHGLAVDADYDRLVQVLSNLVTNAARYTPPGGQITVSAERSADHVVLSCEDNGPGIADAMVGRLFQPFAQGPRALDRREGGLGLGLSLARTFTEMHDGTVGFESVASGGSRFIVTLPLAALPPSTERVVPPPRLRERRPQRVLIVDDNVDACETLQSALAGTGHVTAVAHTGPDAIAVATAFNPDVVVLDIGLPGMDGYEVARRLRAARPSLRLIALTGYGQDSDRGAASAAGFDAHCAKPITIATLLDHIDGLNAA